MPQGRVNPSAKASSRRCAVPVLPGMASPAWTGDPGGGTWSSEICLPNSGSPRPKGSRLSLERPCQLLHRQTGLPWHGGGVSQLEFSSR